MAKKKSSQENTQTPEVTPSLDNDADETADTAANSIIESAPVPNEDAIAAMQETTSEVVNDDVDGSGAKWDAQIHSANKVKTKFGLWKKKRGKAQQSSNSTVRLPEVSETQTRQAIEAKARMAGVAAANSIFLLGTAFGGEEWQPRTTPIEEKPMMEQLWGDYFCAKGVTDFPPGVALCMGLLMYAAPRFTMPKTQARAKGLKAWFMLRIAKRKLKKELKKRGINAEVEIIDGKLFMNGEVYNAARSVSRDVGERKDDSREAQASSSL